MQKETLVVPSLPELRKKNMANLYRHVERGPEVKPVIIVPPLGNVGVVIENLALKVGILTVAQLKKQQSESASPLPAIVTTSTIEKGLAPSPEGICIPFAIGEGYMEQEIEELQKIKNKTGDKLYPLILTHQSSGLCRERVYGDRQLQILEKTTDGDFDFYILKESLKGIIEFTSFIAKLSKKPWLEILKLTGETIERLNIITEYEDKIRFTQSLLKHIDDAEPFLEEARKLTTQNTLTNKELRKKLDEGSIEKKGKKVYLNELTKVREEPNGIIGITGEIFLCEELMNNSSLNLGRILLKEGYYFKKEVGIHEYTSRFKLNKRIFESLSEKINPWKKDEIREAAERGGLEHDAGGHSKDIVALFQRQSEHPTYDGIIILAPQNCTPVIVALNMISAIERASKDSSGKSRLPPHISVARTDQEANTGLVTRIEAFLDLSKGKRNKEKKEKTISPQGEIFQGKILQG